MRLVARRPKRELQSCYFGDYSYSSLAYRLERLDVSSLSSFGKRYEVWVALEWFMIGLLGTNWTDDGKTATRIMSHVEVYSTLNVQRS